MNAEKFRLGDLNLKVFDEAFAEIRDHFTAFIVGNRLAGSGTLVKLRGIPGILTAKHVWDYVKELARRDPQVGLMISEQRHSFSIHIDRLVPLVNIDRKSDAFGPDFDFIKIPAADVGTIEARKSFYNLDVKAAEKLKKAKNAYGVCVVFGAPAERVKRWPETPTKEVRTTVFVSGMILQRKSPKKKFGFDYWELKTMSAVEGHPEDFGGVSGGGVWRVILGKKKGASMDAAKAIGVSLGGVAFYQSALKDGFRFLRAHGPETIYKKLPRIVAAASAT